MDFFPSAPICCVVFLLVQKRLSCGSSLLPSPEEAARSCSSMTAGARNCSRLAGGEAARIPDPQWEVTARDHPAAEHGIRWPGTTR